jgi:gag-polyprotein putative aspartyl protease
LATITVPVKIIGGGPTIPVKVTNPKTNKSLTIPMKLDTGWDTDRIDLKYGNTLGFNPAEALSSNNQYKLYLGTMTIGTLKPITTYIAVSNSNIDTNIFGALPMRQFDKFIISKAGATISDSTTGGGTPQGLVSIMKDFNKYSFTSGYPVLAGAKQAAFALANAFATITVPGDNWNQYHYPVKFYNVKTNQPVSIPMTIDTGGYNVTIGPEWAPKLGVNLKSGQPAALMGFEGTVVNQYVHKIKIQIGTLKPLTVPVAISEKPVHRNLLGWPGVLERYRIEAAKGYMKISDEVETKAALAMSRSGSNFRRRI